MLRADAPERHSRLRLLRCCFIRVRGSEFLEFCVSKVTFEVRNLSCRFKVGV